MGQPGIILNNTDRSTYIHHDFIPWDGVNVKYYWLAVVSGGKLPCSAHEVYQGARLEDPPGN
eukprot:2084327-Pyramimonas_sp.AAC.1